MKYIAFIHQDEEDNTAFNAIVPDLKGCVSYGKSFEKACEMVQEAAELWLEDEKFPKANNFAYFTNKVRKEFNIPKNALTYIVDVKQDSNVRINVMIGSSLLKEVDEKAKLKFNSNRSAYFQELAKRDLNLA